MEDRRREPIAVVGMACRFPQAPDPRTFWRLLRDGVDAVGEIPADRWSSDLFYDPDPQAAGRTSTRWAALLDGIDLFDSQFFRISPREAAHMDPQQRLLLEVAWEALEDAGAPPDSLAGSRTGVFAGVMFNEYGGRLFYGGDPQAIDAYSGAGNIDAILANRISYLLDLQGPSLAVDTACSSSLVAVHLACCSLRSGECDLALAGGVNVVLSPGTAVYYSRAGLMASDGRCKAFDARADGFVRGEGAGLVVLKPLSRALADGDPVRAVIRGSAVNHDGRGNGLTAPNPHAQERVIREAWADAGAPPWRAAYVEAHGSGTRLGDPIELKALGAVVGPGRPDGQPCAVGSVKSNIGHLESAAGIAGLIKAVLCLENGVVPPSLHFETPSPFIPFDRLGLRVPTRLEPLSAGEGPALAGVSSFGFGGANAHVVLETAPAAPPLDLPEEPGPWLLPLSARAPEALRAAAQRLRELAGESGGPAPHDLCRTAAVHRSHHDYRLALTFDSPAGLTAGLDAFLAGRPAAGLAHGRRSPSRRRKVAFVFSGQGPQWPGMGRELLDREPVFLAAVEACDRRLSALAGWSLLAELVAQPERSRLEETEVAQPAIFALQVGLAALWRSWGIEPDAVVGHSLGEVAAACVAGCLTLEDGVRVVHHRGRLMQRAAGLGKMASVGLSEERAREVLEPFAGRLSIAAVNGPSSTVISGEPAALEELLAGLAAREVEGRAIRGAFAFHSPQMEPFSAKLAEALAGLAPEPGTVAIRFAASCGAEGPGAGYWARQIVEPVRFAEATAGLVAQGLDTFLEIGPHPVLSGALAEILHAAGREGSVLPSLRRSEPERETLLRSLGRLYALGRDVAWRSVATEGRRVPLPSYPWQRERCWLSLEPPRAAGSPPPQRREGDGLHPFSGRRLELATGGQALETHVDLSRFPWLDDHRVQGETILPGTAYLELILAAAAAAGVAEPWWLTDIGFERPLILPGGGTVPVQTLLEPRPGGGFRARVYGRKPGGAWVLHAEAALESGGDAGGALPSGLEGARERCAEPLSGADFYLRMRESGNQWGPAFQGIESIRRREGEALALLAAPAALGGEAGRYIVHPALFDAAVQALAAALPAGASPRGAFVGAGGERLWIRGEPLPARLWSHAVLRSAPGERGAEAVGDVALFDEAGRPLVWVLGARLRYLAGAGSEGLAPAESPASWLYRVDWPETERRSGAAASAAGSGWLLLADRGGLAEALAERLRAAGHETVLVREARELDARRLASRRGVVHLQALDAAGGGAEDLEPAHLAAGGSLLTLARELAAAGSAAPPVWIVTRGAQAVIPGESPAVAQAPMWGLGRALAQEHGALLGGLVDLDPAEGTAGAADRLCEEICRPDGEDQVAFRGGTRHAARLVRAPAPPAAPLHWRRDATYLITGGLGDLGLLVARWMVEQGARRLLLVSRTALPPRSRWSEAEPGGSTARRAAAVRELEALGASVHLKAVDVGDEEALAGLLGELRREGWPPVRGVVHAAGVAELRPLAGTDEAALTAAFRPKAAGAWHLHRLLEGEPLDFFVLFSSITPLHGAFGQGLAAYAAANASLDALAHHRRGLGLPALSIGWGPWAGAGMAARRQRGEPGDARALPPGAALELLGTLLGGPGGHIAVMRIDWEEWGRSHPGAAASPFLAKLVTPGGTAGAAGYPEATVPPSRGALREELLALGLEERARRLDPILRGLIAQVLRISPETLDAGEPLSDRGLDSLSAVEAKNGIERILGVVIPMVQLLSGPSLAELAERLAERLGEEPAPPVARRGPAEGAALPLSRGQRALWFLHQREPGSSAYNVAFAGRIRSHVDVAALRQALQWLVDRHAALRARYGLEQGLPVQRVEPRREVAFTASGVALLSEDELRHRVEEEYRRPFDLARGPLLRAHLLTRGAEDHVLLLAAHHIAVDGWSLFLMLDELRALYPAALAGAEPSLPPPAAEYADYVREQEEILAGPEGERLWEHWRRRLTPPPPPLELPTDRPRPKLQTFRGASCPFAIPRETAAGLRELARSEGATLFMALAAVLQALLHRISGQDEIAIGSATAGRSRADLDGVVGHFVNSIVLRADLSANPTFRDLLRQVRQTALEAFEHQDYPFPLLVERLQPAWDPSRSPLFQVSFVLQSLPGLGRMPGLLADTPGERAAADFGGLWMEPYPLDQQAGQHELELEVYERPGSLLAVLQYNTDLFDESTIEVLGRRLAALAASAAARPQARVSELEMLTEDERRERAGESARRHEADLRRLRGSRRRGVRLPEVHEEAAFGNEGGTR